MAVLRNWVTGDDEPGDDAVEVSCCPCGDELCDGGPECPVTAAEIAGLDALALAEQMADDLTGLAEHLRDMDDGSGDPRRCPYHPHVKTSSPDGASNMPSGECEAAMDRDDESDGYEGWTCSQCGDPCPTGEPACSDECENAWQCALDRAEAEERFS